MLSTVIMRNVHIVPPVCTNEKNCVKITVDILSESESLSSLYLEENRRIMDRAGITMKERPVTERPYEKCLANGARSLSDGELLAVVIRSGTRQSTALDLACQLLDKHPVYKGLSGLHHLDYHQLLEIPGIGKVKAIELLCVLELSKRLAQVSRDAIPDFSSPEKIAGYYMEELRHLDVEQVKLLMLNGKHRLIRDALISTGSATEALVSVKDIFLAALRDGAVYIILMHNHPSGDPEPSQEDILLTRRIMEAGALVGIPLTDHIVIGDRCYVSFRERGILVD